MTRPDPHIDRHHLRVRTLPLLLALLALVACTNPQPPVENLFVTLQATPTSVPAGEPTTLYWSVAGTATALSITPGVGDVTGRNTATVTPTATTTYVLTARGPAGSSIASATVVVQPPPTPPAPTITMFTTSPTTITAGDSTTLAWNVSGSVTNLTITPDIGNVTGLTSTTLTPSATTTFTLTATGPGGSTNATAEVTVEPLPAPTIEAFTADPSTIMDGDTTTLAWSVSGTVDSLTITPDIGDVTGLTSTTVAPTGSLTYTLTATGPGGSDSAATDVVVVFPTPPVIDAFTATPTVVQPGEGALLAWSVSGTVDSLAINPDVGDVTGLTSVLVTPASTTTYQLVANGPAGSIGANADVVVSRPPTASFERTQSPGTLPVTVEFDASASSDPDGLPLTYAWSFGDGVTATGAVVQHTYQTAGTFTTTLTITDASGLTATATADTRVRGAVEILAGMSNCAAGVNPRYVLLTYTIGSESSQRTVTPEAPVTLRVSVDPGTPYSASARVYCGGDATAGTAILRITTDSTVVFTGTATGHGQVVQRTGTY